MQYVLIMKRLHKGSRNLSLLRNTWIKVYAVCPYSVVKNVGNGSHSMPLLTKNLDIIMDISGDSF